MNVARRFIAGVYGIPYLTVTYVTVGMAQFQLRGINPPATVGRPYGTYKTFFKYDKAELILNIFSPFTTADR